MGSSGPRRLQIERLKLEIYPSAKSVGAAVARAAAAILRELADSAGDIGIVFATGVSQLDTLRALTSMTELPWDRVNGFHLDEYLGLSADHPASFRHYLRKNLTERVKLRHFFEIDGTVGDPQRECVDYAQKLRSHNPDLCFLGIGENGHLAFNDPAEADFQDPQDVKIVDLDKVSRRQQIEEHWFKRMEEVPTRAITLTIPAILRVPRLLVTAPGRRKAGIVRRTLEDSISTACPATILREHPNATLFLDANSAAELKHIPALDGD